MFGAMRCVGAMGAMLSRIAQSKIARQGHRESMRSFHRRACFRGVLIGSDVRQGAPKAWHPTSFAGRACSSLRAGVRRVPRKHGFQLNLPGLFVWNRTAEQLPNWGRPGRRRSGVLGEIGSVGGILAEVVNQESSGSGARLSAAEKRRGLTVRLVDWAAVNERRARRQHMAADLSLNIAWARDRRRVKRHRAKRGLAP